jgi:hypothetical protein
VGVVNLLITGTRAGRPDVWWYLGVFLHKHGMPDKVVLGDARGVDTQATRWARRHVSHDRIIIERAAWRDPLTGLRDSYGGHKRNQKMVDHCGPGDWCLAFPHPQRSPGTLDCIERAKLRGMSVAICKLRNMDTMVTMFILGKQAL